MIITFYGNSVRCMQGDEVAFQGEQRMRQSRAFGSPGILALSEQNADLSAAQALLSLSPRTRKCKPIHFLLEENQDTVSKKQKISHENASSTSSHAETSPSVVSCCESASVSTLNTSASDLALQRSSCNSEKAPFQHKLLLESKTTSLALDTDEDYLSPLHCFERRYCVEAFVASEEDISEPRYSKTHGARLLVGQVGIRCIHCKHRPLSMRGERAVCFPSSLKNIYHSVETWQRRHFLACSDIPKKTKKTLFELTTRSKSGAGGRRGYWEESARRVGLFDTSNGIRFDENLVYDTNTTWSLKTSVPQNNMDDLTDVSSTAGARSSFSIIQQDDKELITSYLFLLMEQMETCRFTEDDRAGGRSKIKDCPVGYPGMQCKHCEGKAGFGRYFPTSAEALSSANSDRNIYNHVSKCRRCPQHVKETLIALRDEQSQAKNRRGSRKLFFERVWSRIWSRIHCY